ncbi:hypothetical protein Taro_050777 [Colocasia esculenta]|uniref:TRF2/HOY1 PH-like domain-containing protein n=1 Tax=Colocasia esculenta TaxID=4460 RepID=A0A843XE99_COLES|nr:hypothetical protein [Colocasia esculenta]
MVHLADPGRLRPESEVPLVVKGEALPAASGAGTPVAVAVKLEVEDALEDEHGPDIKRFKFSGPFQQWNADSSAPLPLHNPLSAPLGLNLKKSPSFLDLIQMRLSQGISSKSSLADGESPEMGKKKDIKSTSGAADKLKASNFPATLLRIGTWECVSRYEGDLVAKCYFAKRKLVWEVLDGGLKSKIEIQWSDITAIKAACPDNGQSTLDIVLARQPLFFKETNPQPRKHTLWQATSDFTRGQASSNRMHFLQIPQGLLSKHFEKLIQCDPRLSTLSRQPDIILDSPYFETKCSVFDDQDEAKCLAIDHIKGDYGSPFSGLHDAASPSSVPLSSTSESKDMIRTPELRSRENPSPSSVMDSRVIEENTSCEMGDLKEFNKWDQFKLPGIHPSMSLSDFVNHIEQCISEKMDSGIPLFEGDACLSKEKLEEIRQCLLNDSQTTAASDENSLMSRVDSLCCLLQKDSVSGQNLQMNENSLMSRVNSLYSLLQKDPTSAQSQQMNRGDDEDDDVEDETDSSTSSTFEKKSLFHLDTLDEEFDDATTCTQQPPISRKESAGDLLYLPRIASMPYVLYSIADDAKSKAR